MNTAYPLIPVFILTVTAYAVTRGFSKWGLLANSFHRKFWNTILLLTFLVSGLLGILSIIKINYKLTIPQYDTYLKWHVSFGIVMVILSFFHLSWHIKYYLRFFNIPRKRTLKPPDIESGKEWGKKFAFLLFLLGFCTIVIQVIFIREFISVLSGNELIIGIVMATWFLLSGLGAYSGRKRNLSQPGIESGFRLISALSLLPMVMITLLYYLKHLLFPPGTVTGIGIALASSAIFLFPVCYLSGFLFTFYSSRFSFSKNKNLIGKSYALESAGSLAGGLIFSLALGQIFNAFQILSILSGITFFAWFIFSENHSSLKKSLLLIFAVGIPASVFVFNPDTKIKSLLYPTQEIIFNRSTGYGNLIVTRQAGQMNFYQNNNLQFYTDNLMANEEAIHFAMVQHNNPKKVLLLSGGLAGMTDEILKYPVQQIDYLEISPAMVKAWKNLAGTEEFPPKVHFIRSDIRRFLQKNKTRYDVILINLPPPSTIGFNRFYTEEFFKRIQQHSSPNCIVCTSLPTTANYAEKNALELNASLYKTLNIYFPEILILPGEKNYFLASENPLSCNITELIDQKAIKTEYVNSYYFSDELLKQKGSILKNEFANQGKINRDFSPFMFLKQVTHWLSNFNTSYYLLALIPGILFILIIFRLNPVSMGLYTGGFTAASLEIILMLTYQVFFGGLYLAVALFFAIFMGGLATGSYTGALIKTYPSVKMYYRAQVVIALLSVIIPFMIILTARNFDVGLFAQVFFFILTFVVSFMIGYEFYLAAELQKLPVKDTSGLNYGTDLAGSAFGAFLTAIVLLPLVGIVATCLIIAGLNLFSAAAMILSRKSFRI